MELFLKKIKKCIKRHRGTTILAAFALIMVLGVSVKNTMAYFTTYVTAKGGVPITLGTGTNIREEFKDWKKTIQIENTGDVDCFVRVKVIAGSEFSITGTGSGWSEENDGYWYYSEVVPVGGMTEALVAAIHVPEDWDQDFNVVVVQECTPAVYNEDGTVSSVENADWAMAATYVEEAE